jgi:subtilisin-like proprotein convertase family protein
MTLGEDVFGDFAGLATLGGKGLWMQYESDNTVDFSLLVHEMGHCLGLNHAGIWQRPTTANTNPLSSTGTFEPYGSSVDPMGNATNDGFVIGHYSAHHKFLLGWLSNSQVKVVDRGATVTIYAHDGSTTAAGRVYGVRIPVADSDTTPGRRDYWLDTRTVFDGNIPAASRDGVFVQWGDIVGAEENSCLLDMTPNSISPNNRNEDFYDAILRLNTTFSDPWQATTGNRVTVRPTASGGTGADKWVTVQITTPNADLTALALSAGTLTPAFSPEILEYDVSLPGATTVNVTPTSASGSIQTRINGAAAATLASGSARTVTLSQGMNVVEVIVTQGDWKKTYRLRVAATTAIPAAVATLGAIPDGLSTSSVSPGAPLDVRFNVSGFSGTLTALAVDFTFAPAHNYASDVRALLIAPNGTSHRVISLSHVFDGTYLRGPYVFADDAAGRLGDVVAILGDGIFAPAGRYRTQNDSNTSTSLMTTFGALSGTNLNGQWTLRFTDLYQTSYGSVGSANLYLTSSGGQIITRPRASLTRLPSSNTISLSQAAATTNYQIQRSTGLQSWTTLQTLTTNAAGGSSYTDTAPPAGRAFYRFALP